MVSVGIILLPCGLPMHTIALFYQSKRVFSKQFGIKIEKYEDGM